MKVQNRTMLTLQRLEQIVEQAVAEVVAMELRLQAHHISTEPEFDAKGRFTRTHHWSHTMH